MTYAKVLIASLITLTLSGCASAAFNVSVTQDASADTPLVANDETGVTDAGADGTDSEPLVCEPYSCKPECGECSNGLKCGNGGSATCGSSNCASFVLDIFTDAATYNCPSDMSLIYKCAHYYGQNTKDVMPRCLSRGGSTADGEYTYWCCPQ